MGQLLLHEIGSQIDSRFRIEEFLGSGAFGEVYRASDTALRGETVAIKILYPHLLHRPAIIERFRNEVKVARSLSHPNIIRVFEWGQSSAAGCYFVMEYVRGVSLRRLMEGQPKGRLPIGNVVRVLAEVSDALRYAHREGIIHRDLKPDNILIDESGNSRVLDFGLARALEEDLGLTKTGESLGTAYYMSPEQFRGELSSPAVDLYALGIMGYELISGSRPFLADVYFELANQHVKEPLPAIPAECSAPSWLEEIIQRCCQKLPADRSMSAEEIFQKLFEHLEVGQLRTHDELVRQWKRSEQRRNRENRRKRLLFILAASVLQFLLFIFGFALFCRVNTRQWEALVEVVYPLERRFGSTLFWPLRAVAGIPASSLEPQAIERSYQNWNRFSSERNEREAAHWLTITNTLVRLGDNLQFKVGQDGETFLNKIMSSGPEDTLRAYFAAGGDPNVKDNSGRPMAHVSAYSLNYSILSVYLEQDRFDPNATDKEGWDLLHIMAKTKNPTLFSAAINHPRTLTANRRNIHGYTPLHLVLLPDNPAQIEMTNTLMKSSKVDPTIRFPAPDGRSPLEFAIDYLSAEVVELLLRRNDSFDLLRSPGEPSIQERAERRGEASIIEQVKLHTEKPNR